MTNVNTRNRNRKARSPTVEGVALLCLLLVSVCDEWFSYMLSVCGENKHL